MSDGFYEVSVVNKGKKTKKKKAAKKKATKKKPAKKKKASAARKSKSNMPKKSSKNRSKGNPKKKGRARRAGKRAVRRVTRKGKGPGGMVVDPMGPFRGGKIIPRMLGKIVSTYAVRKWGDPAGGGDYSATTGSGWSVKNYAIALIASLLGGELIGRMTKDTYGQQFYEGGVELVATKMVWTEVIGRFPAAKAALGTGEYRETLQQLAARANEGDVIDDGNGNRWVKRGGKLDAMMGIEEAGALGDDGYEGIEEAGPMGDVVDVGPMGHLMSASATNEQQDEGRYGGRGSVDPYQAAYM